MKIRIILIYFLLIFPAMSGEKYLYFDDQNIFYHNKNLYNSYFLKLRNLYEIKFSKFDAIIHLKKNNKQNRENIKINDRIKFKKNFNYNLDLNIKDFFKKKSLSFFKNDTVIDEFLFPHINIKNKNFIINNTKTLIKRNILNRIKKIFNSNLVLYKDYNNFSHKAKLKDINVLFNDYKKNLITIESNQNITEFFIKFESESFKHLGYFNKKIYQDGNKQYFSVIEETVNKVNHIKIVEDLKLNSGDNFYITEIQVVFDKISDKDKLFNSFSLSNIYEDNLENLNFLITRNKQNFSFNINKYIKQKLNIDNLETLTMISQIDSVLLYEKINKNIIEERKNNLNIKKLKKLLNDKNNFVFAEIINVRDMSKIYFVLCSLFPVIIFMILSHIMKIKLNISKKLLKITKNLMKLSFAIFVILFLITTYSKLINLGVYTYFAFIFFLVNYIIVKKYHQLNEENHTK